MAVITLKAQQKRQRYITIARTLQAVFFRIGLIMGAPATMFLGAAAGCRVAQTEILPSVGVALIIFAGRGVTSFTVFTFGSGFT